MPEDRFGDLGRDPSSEGNADDRAAEEGAAAAAKRAALQDEIDARQEEPEEPPRRVNPYVIFVGLALLVLVVVAVVNSAGGREGSSIRGPARGALLLPFAAPLATGTLEGDANINPGPGRAEGVRPACEVRGPDVVNLCALRRRPLVLTFVVRRQTECEPQLDVVERVRRAMPSVQFVAVVSGEGRAAVEETQRRRGWRFPVAVDQDGAVVNLNRITVCPTTSFVRPGGRVRETKIGLLSERELRAAARELMGRTR